MSDLIDAPRPPRRGPGRPKKNPAVSTAPSATLAIPAPAVERPEVRAESPREPNLRTDFRPSDPRDEAARFVEAYDEHNDGVDEGVDKYKLDLTIIPEGWDYNWKRNTIYNQPDPGYQAQLRRAGWRPVPTGRHPELMPPGHPKEQQIVLDGLGLYERPLELSARQRIKERDLARAAVRAKEMQAGNSPNGTLDRTRPTINKEYAHIPIPKAAVSPA